MLGFFKPPHFFGHDMMNGKVGDRHRVAGSKHVLVPSDVAIVQHQIFSFPDKRGTRLLSTLRIRRAMEAQVTIVHTLRLPMQKGFHEGHAIDNRIVMFQIVHFHIEATDRTPRGCQSVGRGAKHELIRRQQIKNVDPRVRQRNGTQADLPWAPR